jgi:hypothetical protein
VRQPEVAVLGQSRAAVDRHQRFALSASSSPHR